VRLLRIKMIDKSKPTSREPRMARADLGRGFAVAPTRPIIVVVPSIVVVSSIVVVAPRRFVAIGPGRRRAGHRAVFHGSRREVAKNTVREFEVTLEFCNRLAGGLVAHQGIETLTLFLDAISEIAQSPFFDLHDGAFLAFDDLVESFNKFFIARPFFRMHDKKSFV